jgi:hypothetical protein
MSALAGLTDQSVRNVSLRTAIMTRRTWARRGDGLVEEGPGVKGLDLTAAFAFCSLFRRKPGGTRGGNVLWICWICVRMRML